MDITKIRMANLEIAVSEMRTATLLAEAIARIQSSRGKRRKGDPVKNLQKQISAWRRGRPMSNEIARDIDAATGHVAGWMDKEHTSSTRLTKEGSEEAAQPELQHIRLRDSLLAVRYAVAAMATVMAVKRPAEGARVAAVFRSKIPEEFQDAGFGKEFLEAIEKASAEVQTLVQHRLKR
jgi:hypothetical protein